MSKDEALREKLNDWLGNPIFPEEIEIDLTTSDRPVYFIKQNRKEQLISFILQAFKKTGGVFLDPDQSLPLIMPEQCHVNVAINYCPVLKANFKKIKEIE